ncbi:GyrI-like domain-containing protein [Polyangium mundeleinium]|uniref:GyrI-like domain-containing protein n=1 Tax=Polyangium mundeleinium TaxID=2995306 RepID=A0ABT5F5E8_9BACT|nr:GyrI-like domain-containing protein [Polyangium mundeleinium]MDC0749310.1 GyrI-like domain-containing protein [Polyangium mundeleinium]
MNKIDLKSELKDLYKPSAKEVVEVDVPAFNFLMVDGEGNPNTSKSYKEAVEALYSVSYTIKFALKKEKGLDYVVMPLEGLWWADDLTGFSRDEKESWKWTMMIMQPPEAAKQMVQSAIASVQDKKGLPGLKGIRFEQFGEGRCAQTLHVGPFSAEGPTIQRVHDYISSRSALRGKHHEIYLSDIRKAAPEKWKTIIRQPME